MKKTKVYITKTDADDIYRMTKCQNKKKERKTLKMNYTIVNIHDKRQILKALHAH